MNDQPTLFDAVMNRNEVYHAIAPTLHEKRAQVLTALLELGEASDQEIADKLHWTINRVTGRRFELQDLELVEQVGTARGPYGHSRSIWKVNTINLTNYIKQHAKEQ